VDVGVTSRYRKKEKGQKENFTIPINGGDTLMPRTKDGSAKSAHPLKVGA